MTIPLDRGLEDDILGVGRAGVTGPSGRARIMSKVVVVVVVVVVVFHIKKRLDICVVLCTGHTRVSGQKSHEAVDTPTSVGGERYHHFPDISCLTCRDFGVRRRESGRRPMQAAVYRASVSGAMNPAGPTPVTAVTGVAC